MAKNVNRIKIWETWEPVLTDEKYGPVVEHEDDQKWMAIVCENNLQASREHGIEKLEGLKGIKDPVEYRKALVTESANYSNPWSDAVGTGYTGTDTTAGHAQMLNKRFRRGAVELISPELMGVQAMTSPNGFVLTIKGRYKGNGNQTIAIGEGYVYFFENDVSVLPNWTPQKDTPITDYDANLQGHMTQAVTGAQGIVKFRSGKKILFEHVPGSPEFDDTNTVSVGNGAAPGNDPQTSTFFTDNEAGYLVYFEEWSRSDFPADYEVFANSNTPGFSEATTEVQEMGVTITQSPVTVQTRKLKFSIPQETVEDARANAGLNMITEASNECYREMNLNQNREAVKLINTNSTITPGYDVDTGSDGRWYLEKIMGLVMQIDTQAQKIQIDTRRGIGNKLLVSPLVRVALSQLDTWTQNKIRGTRLSGAQSYAGDLAGRYRVFTDIFAETDYINVIYRGGPTDAGWFYCPYVGLQYATGRDQQNLWNTIGGLRTRYGMLKNPFGPQLYHRYMPITGLSKIGIYY